MNSNTIAITGGADITWISGLEGVVRVQSRSDKHSYTNFTDTTGIGNKYVYNILCDSKQRVWFATDGEGISELDNERFKHLKNKPGYIGNVVYKILEDKFGNIWYATYDKGVVKYDGRPFMSSTINITP